MREAKARNPDIILMGLEWGVPGWMQGGFWSEDNLNYILKWLDCAANQGLKIEYIGGWNERKFNAEWYIKMSRGDAQTASGLLCGHSPARLCIHLHDHHGPEQRRRPAAGGRFGTNAFALP